MYRTSKARSFIFIFFNDHRQFEGITCIYRYEFKKIVVDILTSRKSEPLFRTPIRDNHPTASGTTRRCKVRGQYLNDSQPSLSPDASLVGVWNNRHPS